MKCTQCGAALEPPQPVDLPYEQGMGVILVGVPARHCPDCGDVEYTFHQIEALDLTVAAALVAKPARLTGREVRFLRSMLDWPGKTLARRLGVRPETVSRWENGALAIGETPDKLLRMFVLHAHPTIERVGLERFDEIARCEGEPLALRLSSADGWRALAA